jgi:hypothetical protein
MEVLAACHIHSEWSYDGSWPLDELAIRFARRGYRILMMTEHDRGFSPSRLGEFRKACARASSETMLVLPGIEYSDPGNRVHVLVWGRIPFLGEGVPTGTLLEAVTASGGLAVLAHPSRRTAWTSFEPRWAEALLGIEVWNRKYDGWAPSDTAPALVDSSGAIPFVGLDFHTVRQSFPLSMALDIEGTVNEDAVLDCLRSRKCRPRAFGVPLSRGLFRRSVPLLNAAEQSRRTVASVRRFSRRPHRITNVDQPPATKRADWAAPKTTGKEQDL